jgi:hypothetical protein
MMKQEPIDLMALEVQVGNHWTPTKPLFSSLMSIMKPMVLEHSENIVLQVSIHEQHWVSRFSPNNSNSI